MIEDLADEGVGVATAKTRLCGEHDAVSEDGGREVLNIVGENEAAPADGGERTRRTEER